MIVELKFAIGERVTVDEDMRAVITEALIVHGPVIRYKAEWFHNGETKSGWFDEFRIS